jgi:DUF4097 and DUF4098 domain-containing protein YvlB
MRRMVVASCVVACCVVALVLTIYGVRAARRHVDRTVVARSIHAVEVDSGIGDVEVVGERRTDVAVTRAYRYALVRPSLRLTVVNGVLRLVSRCSRFDFGCTVRTRVEVPEATRLSVRVQTGGVEVRRLRATIDVDARFGGVSVARSTGPVAVRTGTGPVTLEQVQGEATVRTGKGDVVLDAVQGSMRVSTREGDIKGRKLPGGALHGSVESGIVSVAFTGPPSRVSVRTRVGGVTVRVPVARYSVRARADAGRVRIRDVGRDPRSGRVIDVRAGAGDVAIRGQPGGTAAARSRR